MSIHHIAFNNVTSHLVCSTDQGFIVYVLQPDLEKKIIHNPGGSVGISKILQRTNILMLVGGGSSPFRSKDTMALFDTQKKEIILEISMREPIKNILILNKNHLLSVLEKKICLFNWHGKHLDSKATYYNEKGLCAMNTNSDVIATLGLNQGEIAIWKYTSDIYKIIKAHYTNIEAISLSPDGKYVATASERGTIVRVFNLDNDKMDYEFRRGSQGAIIHDICFSNDTKYLACNSGNGTIHIWDLYNDPSKTRNTQSILSGFKDYLPQYFSSEWSMKTVSISDTSKSICAFDENNDLHIVTYEGNYFKVAGRTGEFTEITKGSLHINNK